MGNACKVPASGSIEKRRMKEKLKDMIPNQLKNKGFL
jgi:hypothetical protein